MEGLNCPAVLPGADRNDVCHSLNYSATSSDIRLLSLSSKITRGGWNGAKFSGVYATLSVKKTWCHHTESAKMHGSPMCVLQ